MKTQKIIIGDDRMTKIYNIKNFIKNERDNSFTADVEKIDPNFNVDLPPREITLWNDQNMLRAMFILQHTAEEKDRMVFTYKSKYMDVPEENTTVYLRKGI